MRENTDSRCTTTVTVRGTRLWASGVSGFLCLSFFAAAKKVSAAPHRGNANRPISIQGKAKKSGHGKAKTERPKVRSQKGQKPRSRKAQRRRQPTQASTYAVGKNTTTDQPPNR